MISRLFSDYMPARAVEACMTNGNVEKVWLVTFPPDTIVGQLACPECVGTGWWSGPNDDGPCVTCKGTGLVHVAIL